MSRQFARTILSGLVIVLITVGLLALVEFGLRLMFKPAGGTHKIAVADSAYEFDPDFLIRLKTNVEKTFRRSSQNGGETIAWRTNRHGYRGPALMENPDFRVVVYGDSSIQAEFSRLENTFVFKLQEVLKARTGRNVEAVNAGIIGFGPDQNLIRMAREITTLKPDVIVFHIFADNDFGDIVRNRLFDLDPSGRLVQSKHAVTLDEAFRSEGHRCERTLADWLYLAKAARKVARIIGLQETQQHPPGISSAEGRVLHYWKNARQQWNVYADRAPRCYSTLGDTYDIDVATSPDLGSTKGKIALMGGVLAKASQIAREHGASFFVQVQPSSVDITTNFRVNHTHLAQFEGYDPRNLSRSVMRACREQDLDCIDLFPLFTRNDPASLYFKGKDNHWNDAGQALAAKAVGDHIASRLHGVSALQHRK